MATTILFVFVIGITDYTLQRTDQKRKQNTLTLGSLSKDPRNFLKSLGSTTASSVGARNSRQTDGWSTTSLHDCLVHPEQATEPCLPHRGQILSLILNFGKQ